MKTFIKKRGKHNFQFYRLIYKKGKSALLQLVKREWPSLDERVAHQKQVDIPIGIGYGIDEYARENNFSEVGK